MPWPFSEFLEHLRGALEAGRDRRRQVRIALDLLDGVDRLAERISRRQVERDGHRRLLALVVDQQRPDRLHGLGHRGERDRLPRGNPASGHARARARARRSAGGRPAGVGLHVDLRQARRIGAEFRLGLEDDLVVVARRVDRRHLAGAEGVEQLLPDLVDGDAVDRRLLAVDLDHDLRVGDVEVGGDVEQPGKLGDLVAQLRRKPVERRRCRSIAACTGTGSC